MRINEHVIITGRACKLVPYEAHHVETYHRWMQDEEALALTASEPLTLDEEYAMQQSWREDETKLTFIILDLARDGAMAGDVNIYFRESDLDEGEPPFSVGEIEVMVAEPASRRKGIATEALLLMMRYAWTTLRCSRFVAKILASNTASLALFARLGFRELRRVAAFDEVHMGFTMDGAGEARVLECDFELGRAE